MIPIDKLQVGTDVWIQTGRNPFEFYQDPKGPYWGLADSEIGESKPQKVKIVAFHHATHTPMIEDEMTGSYVAYLGEMFATREDADASLKKRFDETRERAKEAFNEVSRVCPHCGKSAIQYGYQQ